MAELKRASNLKAPVSHRFAAGHINIAVVAPGEIVLASFRPVFLLPHSVNAADEFVGINHCWILLDMLCSLRVAVYERTVPSRTQTQHFFRSRVGSRTSSVSDPMRTKKSESLFLSK